MLFHEPIKDSHFSSQIVLLIIIISLICGGLAGLVGSYVLWQNMDKISFLLPKESNWPTKQTNSEKTTVLEDDSASISTVAKNKGSVVSIIISKEVSSGNNWQSLNDVFNFDPFNWGFNQPQPQIEDPIKEKREVGGGTGFIVSEDGLILTNKHVVFDDQAEYEVLTNDGNKYPAKVLAKDPINDLAVIKIEATNLTPLTLGDSDNLQLGQTVIAIGNTLSEFRNTVTKGIISGINRTVEAGGNGFSEVLEAMIQTDAPINPGNSGGPLLNLQGEVIGINTAVAQSGQSIGFAIPINEAKQVIQSIKDTGKIVRPYLGVRYTIINKQIAAANSLNVDYGALVVPGSPEELAVIPGSPADKAGIVANDIVLEVEGQKIDEGHSLARILAKYNPGQEISLKIMHQGEEKTVKVTLSTRPEDK